ncbi:Uncharacterised protein [Bordetella pertussis]|nr:Uncharacterised protein [Bordetella pertussis]
MTPPALVATLPPIWLESSAASDNGSRRLASWAARRRLPRMQPASATMVLATVSSARIAFMRSRLSTTLACAASGVAPPHRPVLPPRGTTGTPACWHSARQRATSSVVRGRTTAWAWPR